MNPAIAGTDSEVEKRCCLQSANQARYFSAQGHKVPIIEKVNVRVNERHVWTMDRKGTLTGTFCRARRRLVSNPACPSLNRKNPFFRSADRDGDGCMAQAGFR